MEPIAAADDGVIEVYRREKRQGEVGEANIIPGGTSRRDTKRYEPRGGPSYSPPRALRRTSPKKKKNPAAVAHAPPFLGDDVVFQNMVSGPVEKGDVVLLRGRNSQDLLREKVHPNAVLTAEVLSISHTAVAVRIDGAADVLNLPVDHEDVQRHVRPIPIKRCVTTFVIYS